jgi:hypothetical protein
MPSTPYPIDENVLKKQANPRSLTDEEMQEYERTGIKPQMAKPAPSDDVGDLTDEEMQEYERTGKKPTLADRNVKAMENVKAMASPFTGAMAKIADYLQAPQRGVMHGISAGVALGRGEPKEAWEYITGDRTAPTGTQLAESAGISKERTWPTPFKDVMYRDIKASPAEYAGAAIDIATDPLTWAPGLPLKAAGKASEVAGKGWGQATKKAASIIASVPESDFEYLIANRDRLKGKRSGGIPGLAENIAQTKAEIQPRIDRAEFYKNKAKSVVDDAKAEWNELKRELKDPIRDTAEQERILANMQGIKDQLKADSIAADEALANSGKMYRRGDIIDLVRNIASEGLGKDIISPQAQRAAERMVDLVQRLGGSPRQPAGFARKAEAKMAEEMLDAPRVRDILKQVRESTNFDLQTGEFDERLDRMNKRFSHAVSTVLKNDVPEYAAYMDKMSGMAQLLKDMRAFTGASTETAEKLRVTNMLNRLRKGGAESQAIRELLEKYASMTNDSQLWETLEQIKDRSELAQTMAPMTFKRNYGTIFPSGGKNLEEVKEAANVAATKAAKLTEIPTESVYNQLSTLKRDQARHLDVAKNIQQETGIPVAQQAQDWGVLNRLEQPRTQGSRMAAGMGGLFGAAGMALGDAELSAKATALGVPVGWALDRYSGRLVKKGVDFGTSVRQAAGLPKKALAPIAAKASQSAKAMFDAATMGRLKDTQWGKVLEKLAQEGFRSFVAYHHLMYDTNQEYRDLVDSLEGK